MLSGEELEFFTASPARRRENFIKSKFPEIYEKLKTDEYNDFITFSDKITKYLFGGGYCKICNARTKKDTGYPGFREYCSPKCAGIAKQGQVAHNKADIDEDIVKDMYLNQKKSPKDIGDYFNVSNVTINKIIEKLGIKRTHSEQQKIHSLKGRIAWNASGIKHYDFNVEKPKSAFEVKKMFNVNENLVYFYALKQDYKFTSKSCIEDTIANILDELGVSYTQNRRNVIFPLEVDFSIPEYNMAIECNGLYHHCHLNKHTAYHYEKYEMCKEKGIQLIQFWEDDIKLNTDKIKYYLKSKFNKNERVFARKCKLLEVKCSDAMNFYNKYHLQGVTKNGKNYGLYYNDELVACMSFSKYDEETVELTRYCTKAGITVVGGFSKLLKLYDNFNIISYSNNDYSNGDVYYKNGFENISINKYNMMYTDFKKRYQREKFMKHKLKNMFPESYCESKTEKQILEENKIYQCIGSGTLKWYRHKKN